MRSISPSASNEDKKILDQLLEYVKNSQDPEVATKYGLRPGIGLAAPQINVSKRMIAVHLTDENENAIGTRVHLKIFYREMSEV